jgi:hypothetical protein
MFTNYKDFFELKGSAVMKLSPKAACQVCIHAREYNLLVGRVEGGFWHHPGFEARLDCIWDSKYWVDSSDPEQVHASNLEGAKDILEESKVHNAFSITTMKCEFTRKNKL